MLNRVEGSVFAMAVMRFAVKLVVAGEARRSWPAGGSFAKFSQGEEAAQAMCSGCEVEMAEVCPGVSISCVKFYVSNEGRDLS